MTASRFEDPYLQSVLENITQEEGFKKPKFSVMLATNPGDNFCGRIYRAVITDTNGTERKSLSLIFKVSPIVKCSVKRDRICMVYRTEIDVYQIVLPTLNKILNKFGVAQSEIFPGTVRCFWSHADDSCHLLVLEDKCSEGFRVIGDKRPLDADHCRQILKKIALLHAASLALNHHEPEAAERLKNLITKEVCFTSKNSLLLAEFKQEATEGLKMISGSFENGNVMFEKMEKVIENYHEEIVDANEVPSDLSCLIHGDCWSSNVLYKYKDDVIEDVCMIDFQMTRIASPAIDVSYMLYLCTFKETRDASFKELIRFYHSEISSLLRMMDCDPEIIMPWDRLEEHLRKYGRVGSMVAFSCIAAALIPEKKSEKGNDNGEELIMTGRERITDPQIRESYFKALTDLVTEVNERGLI